MRSKEVITILKFLIDKRVKRIKSMWKREKEKSELFEREYIKERNKRLSLEPLLFNESEKEYVLSLILLDEVINSHNHTSQGLYTELNTQLLDFISDLRSKIKKM